MGTKAKGRKRGDRLRVLMVGCGGISGAWLQAAQADPRVEVAGLVDLNAQQARARASEFDLDCPVHSDLARALRTERPQAVFNATVQEAHASTALQSLRAGAHVLVEKPLAAERAEARRMIAGAARAGRALAVLQNYRYHPAPEGIRRAIARGAVGRVTQVTACFFLGAHFKGFRVRMAEPLLADMAIHHFDLARLFCGRRAARAYCRSFNPEGSWYEGHAAAAAVFEMAGGAQFTYTGSWCAEGAHTDWNCDWRIVGSKGTIRWTRDAAPTVHVPCGTGFVRRERVRAVRLPRMRHTGHAGAIRSFVRSVLAGRAPDTPAADNIHSFAMVVAALASARRRRLVPVRP